MATVYSNSSLGNESNFGAVRTSLRLKNCVVKCQKTDLVMIVLWTMTKLNSDLIVLATVWFVRLVLSESTHGNNANQLRSSAMITIFDSGSFCFNWRHRC